MTIILALGMLLYLIAGITTGVRNRKERVGRIIEDLDQEIIHPSEFNIRNELA